MTERPKPALTATVPFRAPEGNLLRRMKVLLWFCQQMGLEPVGPVTIETEPARKDAP